MQCLLRETTRSIRCDLAATILKAKKNKKKIWVNVPARISFNSLLFFVNITVSLARFPPTTLALGLGHASAAVYLTTT